MTRGDGGDAVTGPALSSYPADLAERAGASFRLGGARTIEAVAAYPDAGRMLIEARGACAHGEWMPFMATLSGEGRSDGCQVCASV